jgi:hypothetical protein
MKHGVRRQTLSVALFPFLAVLICTMGALIVLLVLFTHHARAGGSSDVAASKAVGDPTPADEKQLRERVEDANWRRDLLEQQRAEKTQELADSRAKLSHLEQHIQELQARAQGLLARARQIDEGKQLRDDELASEREELSRLQQEIAQRQRELDEARKKHESQERWYALIPYAGPNGTRRRPIYIECTSQGIVIQPEGILFQPDDFNGPLGPGNPLDAALRTIREHMRDADHQAGEPYPLLVVRPSGVVAYGAARSALKSWDDEFGYELISDDKRLAYGEPDPALATMLARSVAQARERQAALIAKMPRRFNGDEPLTSFDPADVPGLIASATGTAGRGVGGGSGGTGIAATKPGAAGSSGGGFGFSQNAASDLAAAGPALGSATGGSAGGSSGGGQPGAATTGQVGPYSAAGGSPGNGPTGKGPTGNGTAGGGPATAGATPLPGGKEVSSLLGQPGGATAGSRSGTRSGGVTPGQSRGTNWGLPAAAGRTTGITRPIHIAVLADRFVLVPDPGDDHPPRHLRVSPRLAQPEVDALVTAVQKEMTGWGLAVENGYWKPVLEVEVAPDAEQHYADLQTALQNSGFELHRKP